MHAGRTGLPMLLLASLTGMALADEASPLPMPPATATVSLNGIRCQYPAELMRLPESLVAIRYDCRNGTAGQIENFDPPRLELLDEAGKTYPPDPAANRQFAARFRLDARATGLLAANALFAGLDAFAIPPGLSGAGWRLLVSSGHQRITLSLSIPQSAVSSPAAPANSSQPY